MIPWDEFRPILESVYAKLRKRKAGRPQVMSSHVQAVNLTTALQH